MAVQLVLKSHPDKSIEQLASLADSLVAVTPEASLPGSFSTIAPVAANIDTIASLRSELEDLKCQFSLQRKLANFHLPLPPPLPSHSVGTMPDLARMPPNAKNLALCREMLSPPTDGDQWIGK